MIRFNCRLFAIFAKGLIIKSVALACLSVDGLKPTSNLYH
jgi:hypothetical protein